MLETVTLISLGVAVLSLFLFAWIAENVSHDRTANFDHSVRMRIHEYASPGLTKAMIAISFVGGDGLTIAAILAAIVEGRLPIGVPTFIQAWHRNFDYLYIVGPRVPNPMPALLEELDSASQFILYKIRKPKPS